MLLSHPGSTSKNPRLPTARSITCEIVGVTGVNCNSCKNNLTASAFTRRLCRCSKSLVIKRKSVSLGKASTISKAFDLAVSRFNPDIAPACIENELSIYIIGGADLRVSVVELPPRYDTGFAKAITRQAITSIRSTIRSICLIVLRCRVTFLRFCKNRISLKYTVLYRLKLNRWIIGGISTANPAQRKAASRNCIYLFKAEFTRSMMDSLRVFIHTTLSNMPSGLEAIAGYILKMPSKPSLTYLMTSSSE